MAGKDRKSQKEAPLKDKCKEKDKDKDKDSKDDKDRKEHKEGKEFTKDIEGFGKPGDKTSREGGPASFLRLPQHKDEASKEGKEKDKDKESKEHKDKDKESKDGKETSKDKAEKEGKEFKDREKGAGEKEIKDKEKEGKDGKDFKDNEGGGDKGGEKGGLPEEETTFFRFGGSPDERLNRLEGQIARLSHFIGTELRPDLLTSAMSKAGAPDEEQDLESLARKLEKQAVDAKQAKDTKDLEKLRDS